VTRRWTRLLCAFLALIALGYALLPEEPSFARASGSAFSAATSDVAIGCGIRPELERRALPDRPPPPLPLPRCAVALATLDPVIAPAQPENRERFTAPVSLLSLLTPLSPRAPPAV